MAQLRDTIVQGSLRATDSLLTTTAQFQILKVPTTSGGTTYGPGSSGNILLSNGTSVYWSASITKSQISDYPSSASGNKYTPVYWNSGSPAETTLVQKVPFTINSGQKSVKIEHKTDSNAFKAASIVIQIVVTSGASNLAAPITWKSADNYIALNTTTATAGAVEGYILVVRGTEIASTSLTLTQSTSNI